MGTQKESGLVSRAVREALGTLVSPQVSAQVVERALSTAGLAVIPEAGPALTAWVEGPLRAHIEACVGADAAELVAAQLAPIVAHAASGARAAAPASPKREAPANEPRSPLAGKEPRSAASNDDARSGRDTFGSDQPTGIAAQPPAGGPQRGAPQNAGRRELTEAQRSALTRAPESGNTLRPQGFQVEDEAVPRRRVLTACSAPDAVAALQKYLGRAARVEQVSDLVGLLDALEEPDEPHPIVVVDCQRPTVHVTSIAAIGEDLPHGTTIVLWGSSDATWKDLDRERMPNCRWVRCSQEATTDDVGSLCAMLIG